MAANIDICEINVINKTNNMKMETIIKIIPERKVYVVFGLFNALDFMGIKSNLPKGQYIIPVFDDYDEAKEYAGEKFEVVELSIPNKPE